MLLGGIFFLHTFFFAEFKFVDAPILWSHFPFLNSWLQFVFLLFYVFGELISGHFVSFFCGLEYLFDHFHVESAFIEETVHIMLILLHLQLLLLYCRKWDVFPLLYRWLVQLFSNMPFHHHRLDLVAEVLKPFIRHTLQHLNSGLHNSNDYHVKLKEFRDFVHFWFTGDFLVLNSYLQLKEFIGKVRVGSLQFKLSK